MEGDSQHLELPATPGSATVAETQAEHKVFPPFDTTYYPSQLLWLAITFLLLYWLMAKFAMPRLAGILEVRRNSIAGDLAEAERLKNQSQEAIAAYEKALAEARSRAHGIAEGARSEAKTAADQKRTAIETDLAGKLAAAEAHITDIKTKALAEVGGIASETADAVIRTLTDTPVSRAEIDQAVSSAMAK